MKAFPKLVIHLDLGKVDGLQAAQVQDRPTGRLLGEAIGNSVQREAFVIAKVVRALYGGLLKDKDSRWISTKPCIYILVSSRASIPLCIYIYLFLNIISFTLLYINKYYYQ